MNRAVGIVALFVGACSGSDVSSDEFMPGGAEPTIPGTGTVGGGYDGQEVCADLLEKSGVDRASRCPQGESDPGDLRLPGKAGCLRDSYIFTALAYCWRSMCLAKQGVTEADARAGLAPSSPAREARAAREMLDGAGRLCSTTSSRGIASCTTTGLVPCP